MSRIPLALLALAWAGSVVAADEPYRRVVGFRTHGSYLTPTAEAHFALSADGKWLAAGGAVVDVDNRVVLGPIGNEKSRPTRVLLARDGKRLIGLDGLAAYEPTARRDHLPLLVGPADNPAYREANLPVAFLKMKDTAPKCGCLSADGKEVVLYTHDYTAERWSLAAGKKLADVTVGFAAQVTRVQPLGDTGKYLLLPENTEKPALIWDGETPVLDRLPLTGRRQDYRRIEFAVAPDGRAAYELAEFTFGANGTEWGQFVLTWDLAQRKVLRQDRLQYHEHVAFAHSKEQEHKVGTAVARLPEGRYAVGYADGHVEVRGADHALLQDLTAGRLTVLKSAVVRVAASADGKRVVTLDRDGVIVLYEAGGKPVFPGPTPDEYPIALGSWWTYAVEGEADGRTVVTQATGVDVIGAEPCVRLETHVRVPDPVNRRVIDSYLKSDYVACRKDGVYQVSRFNDAFYILHRSEEFDLAAAAMPLTVAAAMAHGKAYVETKLGGLTARSRYFVRENEAVDTPVRAGTAATRLDRDLETNGYKRVETVHLVKGVGPVRLMSSAQKTVFVLEAYAPGR